LQLFLERGIIRRFQSELNCYRGVEIVIASHVSKSIDWRRLSAAVAKAIAYAMVAALISSVIFLALALMIPTDKNWVAKRIDPAALKQTFRPYLFRQDYPLNLWDHDACLILYMLAARYPSHLEEAVSPLVPVTPESCEPLAELVTNGTQNSKYYHRYLHGYRVTTALLLSVIPLAAIPWTLAAILHLWVALIIIVAGIKIYRSRSELDQNERLTNLGYLAVGISLLLFWGMAQFEASITMAFGDAVIVALILLFLIANPLRMRDGVFVATCCAFGALTAWFEFLSGQTPLMMALIPGTVAISSFAVEDPTLLWRRTLQGIVAFLGTAGLCVMLKWALATAVFGPWLVDQLREAILNITVSTPLLQLAGNQKALFESLGLPVSYDGSLGHWLFWLAAIFALSSPSIGSGSFFFGTGILAVAFLMTIAGLIRGYYLATLPIDRARVGVLIFSLAMLCLWYTIFHSHALKFGSYMVRPLVWLVPLAVVSWLQVISTRGRARVS
jgi:hypothetical protein